MANKKLSALKAQKTKLLKKEVHTKKEFENVQAKLDQVELRMQLIYNAEDKMGIDDMDEEASGLYDLSDEELATMAKFL